MRTQIRDWMRGFGATETLIFAGVALVIVLAVIVVVSQATSTTPPLVEQGDSEKVVPTTGDEGFPVEAFCEDAATEVRERIRPDGAIYELMRVKANVPELVVWAPGPSEDNQGATHYWYDDQSVQMSEPAIVTDGARDCIRDKAK